MLSVTVTAIEGRSSLLDYRSPPRHDQALARRLNGDCSFVAMKQKRTMRCLAAWPACCAAWRWVTRKHWGAVLSDVYPWVQYLPREERELFAEELTKALLASGSIELFEPVALLVGAWKATAEVHADPELARRLAGPHEITHGGARPASGPLRGIAKTCRSVRERVASRRAQMGGTCASGTTSQRAAGTDLCSSVPNKRSFSLGSRSRMILADGTAGRSHFGVRMRAPLVSGEEMEQWQYEVTSGGRIWYCIDDAQANDLDDPRRHRPPQSHGVGRQGGSSFAAGLMKT